MVRSTSSTAIGPSLTMCCAVSIAVWKLPKWHRADRAAAEQRRQLELDPGREAERAFRTHQNVCQVEFIAAGHERVDVVAADPPLHLRETVLDEIGVAGAERQQVAGDRPERRTLGQVGKIGRDLSEMRDAAVRQHCVDRDAHSRGCCRSAVSARRRSCCPPCRRWWRATTVEMSTGNHRPCGRSRRLSSSSTMPGSTTQRLPGTSSSTR